MLQVWKESNLLECDIEILLLKNIIICEQRGNEKVSVFKYFSKP